MGHAVAEGAGTQVVGREVVEIKVDIETAGRVGVFMHGMRGDRHGDREFVAGHKAFAGVGQLRSGRTGGDEIGAIGVDHQVVVVEEVGNRFGGSCPQRETGAAIEGVATQFIDPQFADGGEDRVDHRHNADNDQPDYRGRDERDNDDIDRGGHRFGQRFVKVGAKGRNFVADHAVDKEAPDNGSADYRADGAGRARDAGRG